MQWIKGTNGHDVIDQADGVTNAAEVIWGYDGNDTIFGLGGDDWIAGGAGADTMDGGAGIDRAFYEHSDSAVMVSLLTGTGLGGHAQGDTLVNIEDLDGSWYNDTLVGNDGVNRLWGFHGNDLLKGGGGADTLMGENGNDTLKGGGGADVLDGGADNDTAAYNESNVGVTVTLGGSSGGQGAGFGGDAQGDILYQIENLTGSGYADTLIGNPNNNVLAGLNGNDTLKGYGGEDTLWGGEGHDNLSGSTGDDTLYGEAGDDRLNGGSGRDMMVGGHGNDVYIVDHYGDDVIEAAGQGTDVVRTSVTYALDPGTDIEILETTNPNGTTPLTLTGNSAGNQIIGNNGDNIISGGAGVDEMIGRGGNDIYYVDNVADSVVEAASQGVDEVRTSISYALTAGSDVERLVTLNDGSTGAIDLTGNASGNLIRGNNGNNVIAGGDGNDELTGLGGADSFLFDAALDEAFNVDVITDFNVVDDTIRLDQDVFSNLGLGNIADGEFVIGAAAQDANDRIIYDSNSGALYYDGDGASGAAAIQFAQLGAGLALTHLDFYVV